MQREQEQSWTVVWNGRVRKHSVVNNGIFRRSEKWKAKEQSWFTKNQNTHACAHVPTIEAVVSDRAHSRIVTTANVVFRSWRHCVARQCHSFVSNSLFVTYSIHDCNRWLPLTINVTHRAQHTRSHTKWQIAVGKPFHWKSPSKNSSVAWNSVCSHDDTT